MTISIAQLLILFLTATTSFALNVSLSVEERGSAARTSDPVTTGVPLARTDNILNTSSLGLTGQDAQFRVLSRYDGTPDDTTAPIRVVLVDYQDTVSAGATVTRTLTDGGTGTVSGSNLVSDETTYYEIDTGAITVQINKTSGNIFEDVDIITTPIVTSPTADKWVVVAGSVTYSSVPDSTEIEENGPLRSVVKVMGHFEDSSNNTLYPGATVEPETPDTPLRYTIRYFFYRNKGYVKLQATLRNENKGWQEGPYSGDYIHNAWITESYLTTTVSGLGTNKAVAFDGYSDSTTADSYEILQQETSDGSTMSYTWDYGIEKNAVPVVNGTQYDGAADMRDDSIGLMVADRWFWQNNPIGVTLDAAAETVVFNLFPNTGTDYRLLGASYKTHELMYYFHGTDTTFTDELALLKNKMMLKATDTYLADTNFFFGMTPATITSDYTFTAGESMADVLDQRHSQAISLFDSDVVTNSGCQTIQEIQSARKVLTNFTGDDTHYGTWYGWQFFGAMPRAINYGYHNQHYEWAWLGLSNWLRFDSWKSYDFAQELLMHKVDMLIMHDPDAPISPFWDYSIHGGMRYESDALYTKYDAQHVTNTLPSNAPSHASHLWSSDVTMQYLLSGEYLYYDSAVIMFNHIVRVKDTLRMSGPAYRAQYRGIASLVTGYHLTGNTDYIDVAWQLWDSQIAPYEDSDCPDRSVVTNCTNDAATGTIQTQDGDWDVGIAGDAWLVQPLIRLRMVLSDRGELDKEASIKAFMGRWATWVKDTVMASEPDQGSYTDNNTSYTPYLAASYWDVETASYVMGTAYLIYLQPYADLFAQRYLDSGDEVWLNTARNLLKDHTFYIVGGEQAVTTSIPGGIGMFCGSLTSGVWKIAKSYTTPVFYERVESGLEPMTIQSAKQPWKFNGSTVNWVTD